jgi:flagellar export protein FliJ
MKKFRFRLQTVLDVAKTEEKLALEKFALAQGAVLKEKAIGEQLKQKLINLRSVGYTTSINDVKMRESYDQVLQKRLKFSRQRLLELEKELEDKRLELLSKVQKRQLLDNLKGKAWLKYKLEAQREEQLFLDELGVTRFSRKEGESL